jgi:hypothetical protein
MVAAAGSARADEDFFRSSPGALSASHADSDGQDHCNDCHLGGKALANDKCLGCHEHKDLDERIRAGKGFHASPKVRGRRCETCHLEHQGRGFDLMGWRAVGGQDSFDHAQTGWPLGGKHGTLDCSTCHKRKNRQGLRTFLGENRACGGCHKADQPHGYEREELLRCDRCHGEAVWNPPKSRLEFDHDDKRDAAMPLEGTHAEVACGKCHPKAQFNLPSKVPDDCANCHQSPHRGHLFDLEPCAWCHSPKLRSLQSFRFDHARRTRFDLAGAHGKLGCYDCHAAALATRKPERACESCHSDENPHRDRFAEFGEPVPRCATCHPSSSWMPEVFSHDKRTRFALTGKHATATCRACHRGTEPFVWERFDGKTVGCMGCHKHENVHDREFHDRECLRCHEGPGRIDLQAKSVDIYHGPRSRFPLVEKHAKVKCAQCHINDVYKDTPRECAVRCHEDSLHRGSLGDLCSRCHSGGQWEAVRFDHKDDTQWPLVGWHQSVPSCEDCHPARQYSGTATACGAKGCHAADDAHSGRLGSRCERCHKETGANLFNHNRQSDYKLDGAHLIVKCAECHPSIAFKPRPAVCAGCHPEPDVHRGRFGTVCENCHTTVQFSDIRPLHDVGSFSLDGAHDDLDCRRCHEDSRPLAGSGNLCISCHRQDDIHSNSLSPRCGDCHSQWAFAPARFDHTTVGCNLPGLHRVLPCYDCHKAGNFGPLVPQCYGCHRDTALAVGARVTPDHNALFDCGSCHNPNAWRPGGAGVGTYGRESICR